MDSDENKRPDSAMGEVGDAAITHGPSEEDAQKAKDAGWVDGGAGGGFSDDWAGAGEIYNVEWKDEYGDLGPEVPELEDKLFNTDFRNRQGDFLNNLEAFEVQVEGPTNTRVRKVRRATKAL